MPTIAANIAFVESEIRRVCLEHKRDPQSVRLVAVSKTASVAQIQEAVRCGIKEFGENRAQDALPKARLLGRSVSWHFIGHLQTNKARAVVGFSEWIHSIDSVKLAIAVNSEALSIGKRQKVLLQVNIAEEQAKYGFEQSEVSSALDKLILLESLDVRGFMVMAPIGDSSFVSSVFRELRELAEDERSRLGCPEALTELSMGMTGDYREAIAEGSTMIRVGSAIFGSTMEVV